MKYLLFFKFLIIELLSELDEALAARAQFKAIEKITANPELSELPQAIRLNELLAVTRF
jgi:hypothetical protein